MYTHSVQKRVRYGEVDQMGYLYYGHYAFYYEIGRVEWLRSLGVLYKDMEEEMRVMLPVAYMQMRFVRPATYDEVLTITTTLREMPGKYITFHMELYNDQGQLVNGGMVKLAFVDMNTKRVVEIPEVLKNLLQPFFLEQEKEE